MTLLSLLEDSAKSKKVRAHFDNPVFRFLNFLLSLTGTIPSMIINKVVYEGYYENIIDHDASVSIQGRALPLIRVYNNLVSKKVQVHGVGVVKTSSLSEPGIINAYSLPNGNVLITPGILEMDKRFPGFLEFVLAHELSHLALNSHKVTHGIYVVAFLPLVLGAIHALENIAQAVQGVSGVINPATLVVDASIILIALVGANAVAGAISDLMDRQHEYKSDEISSKLIKFAYGKRTLLNSIQVFKEFSHMIGKKSFTLDDFISSISHPIDAHPEFSSRANRMQFILDKE